MMDLSLAEQFEFPCEHLFKALGPNDPAFVAAVRAAVAKVVPVAMDAMKIRPSGKGNYQSVSLLIRVQDFPQLQRIYQELKQVPDLKYLL